VLTVIGYSLNDTIVVFDRIRENKGRVESLNPNIINQSINQTLSRTLLTSLTTFIVIFVLYVFGGKGVHGFSFALLIGVAVGTYSSVAIAAPLLASPRVLAGVVYVLMVYDAEKFKDTVSQMSQLSESVRKAVIERADASFSELDEAIEKDRNR